MISLLSACATVEGSDTKESDALNRWIVQHVNKDEKLLCQREVNGEYFFLAKEAAGDRVKIGARIDVTAAKAPLTSVVVWHFQNEKDQHLSTKTPPSPVTGGYVKDSGKIYSDGVEYQTLFLKNSEKMHVTIDIKKCLTADCDRQTKGKDDKEYSIKLCEVPLNKR
jgi:hypothetical protein